MKIETLHFKENCNIYIVGDKHGPCIVIDPGYNKNGILDKYIYKNYDHIELILLTHAHFDHISGLRNMKNIDNIPVALGEDDINKLDNPRLNGSSDLTDEDVSIQLSAHGLEDGMMLKALGLDIEVIHTPFHTSGSVCYYIESLNALFSGDTLFHLSIGRSDLPSGSERDIKSSLNKIKKLPLETVVYPGHGGKTTIKNELKFNEYMKK